MTTYAINYTFTATAFSTIEADSLEEAKEKVAKMVDADDFDLDPEVIDSVDFYITPVRYADS